MSTNVSQGTKRPHTAAAEVASKRTELQVNEIDIQTSVLDALRHIIDRKSRDNDILNEQLVASRRQTEKQVAELQTQLTQQQEAINETENKIQQKSEEVARLTEEYTRQVERNESQEQQLNDAREELAKTQLMLTDAQDLYRRTETAKNELEQVAQEATEQIAMVTRDNDNLQRTITIISSTITDALNRRVEAQNDKAACRAPDGSGDETFFQKYGFTQFTDTMLQLPTLADIICIYKKYISFAPGTTVDRSQRFRGFVSDFLESRTNLDGMSRDQRDAYVRLLQRGLDNYIETAPPSTPDGAGIAGSSNQ